MKTRYAVIFFAVATALMTGAFAETVTAGDAENAAKGWYIENGPVFGAHGGAKDAIAVTNGDKILWYEVAMSGGVAIVAPDTEIEPVIAFLPGLTGTLAEDNPMKAILAADLVGRLSNLEARTPSSVGGMKAAPREATPMSRKWARLTKLGGAKAALPGGDSPAKVVRLLDGWTSADTTIAGGAKVQTLRFWNQLDSSGYFTNDKVFNLYTPSNSPCGCVATAGAAVMHYFRVPSGVANLSRECEYGVNSANAEPVTLTTKGGAYDWSLVDGLTLGNGSPVSLSASALDLLGRVAYDCGVGCRMTYTQASSSSWTYLLGNSLRDVFAVRNAQVLTRNGTNTGGGKKADVSNYAKLIYNQIRAGAPVVLGIDGHEVVACGYGIDAGDTEYTYVFVGWGGYGDAWYALPKIETKSESGGSTYESTFIDELITAIAPYDDKYVPVVGRCVDVLGNAVPGTIELGNGETVETDADGYWGARVAPSDPRWFVDTRGDVHTYEIGDAAKTTSAATKRASAFAAALPDVQNVVVYEASVELYDGSTPVSTHGTLDGALAAAARCENPVLSLVGPTYLLSGCTIDFDLEIRGNGFGVAVQGATIGIAAGARVLVSDLSFSGQGAPAVTVAAGGVLAVEGALDIGLVSASGDACVELAGALTSSLTVSSPSSSMAFGTYTCPPDVAAGCANNLLNAADDELGGVVDGGRLVWGAVEVSDAAAVLRLKQGGTSVNFRSFGTLARFVTNDASITVLKNCPLADSVAVGKNLTLYGETPGVTVEVSGAAGFAIVGGALTVSNLVFTGETSDAIFHVGSYSRNIAGQLVLADGATADGVRGLNTNWGGVVMVEKGTATLANGSLITGCSALGRSGYGGGACAIYPGSTIAIDGGEITGCSSMKGGGGVMAWYGARVSVSGQARVTGNTTAGAEDDIHLDDPLTVTGPLTGGAGSLGVRYKDSHGVGCGAGESFASSTVSLTAAQAAQSAKAFRNEINPSLGAEVRPDGRTFLWAEAGGSPAEVDPAEAVVRIVPAGGGAARYYASVSDAFGAVDGDCAIELLCDGCVLDDDVRVDHAVTLRSSSAAGGTAFTLTRAYGTIFVAPGAALELSAVRVSGGVEGGYAEGRLIEVAGGSVVLDAGATVCNTFGDGDRADSAIAVYNRGSFLMRAGAAISDCVNAYSDTAVGYNSGAGGAVLVDGMSTARFLGGEITGCSATFGGGVCVCNGSVAYVSGALRICGNGRIDAASASDFLAEDQSRLYLEAPLADGAEIGALSGFRADTNLVALVEGWRGWNFASLTNSAARFFRDERPVVRGFVVTNASDTALVVWSTGIARNGSYTSAGGEVFYAAGEVPVIDEPVEEYAEPDPIAFTYIGRAEDGESWTLRFTNAVRWCEYAVYGTDELKAPFPAEGDEPVTNFQWKSSGTEVEITLPAEGARRFWRATAAPGLIGE